MPDSSELPKRLRIRKIQVAAVVLIVISASLVWYGRQNSLPLPAFMNRWLHPPRPALRLPIRFVDVAQQDGLHYQWTIPNPGPHNILESIGNGCAFLDYDNDGNLDILLVGPKLALYKGDGHGHFTDVSHATGLDTLHGHFLGCAVGDYDNDGYDDLYISGYQTGLLLHNEQGKRFRDVTKEAGLKPQPFGNTCAFGNLDGSRYLDLFVCNYVEMIPMNMLRMGDPRAYPALGPIWYHNVDGHRFVDVTKALGVDITTGRGLGAAFAPVDAEKHVGLAVANDMGLGDLFMRAGAGHLKNIASESGVAAVPVIKGLNGRMGIDWGDYDNDGLLDLFVTTFHHEPKILLHNMGHDVFEDVGSPLSQGIVLDTLAFGCKWLDADNSGWLDLLISNGHIDNSGMHRGPHIPYRQKTLLLYNRHGHGFVEATQSVGMDKLPPIVGRGLAIGDYDNDGRVDALVVDSEGGPLLLHNESQPVGHWLSLQLIGVKCNRDGYGALVTVTAGGLTQTRLCHSDGSYLSASDKRVHVGLANAAAADTVSIHWVSGHTDTLHNIPADQVIVVSEGNAHWQKAGHYGSALSP